MVENSRDRDELISEFKEQLVALRTACAGYDREQYWQAKHIATILYILFHDGTGRTRSLLSHLGLRSAFRVLSTYAPEQPGTIAGFATPLLGISFDRDRIWHSPTFEVPLMHREPRWLKPQDWYEESVFHARSGIRLSRKNVIFTMRTQDGGSHVDDRIRDAAYRVFSKQGDQSLRWRRVPSDTPVEAITNGTRALVRQFAWELERSLVHLSADLRPTE